MSNFIIIHNRDFVHHNIDVSNLTDTQIEELAKGKTIIIQLVSPETVLDVQQYKQFLKEKKKVAKVAEEKSRTWGFCFSKSRC